MVRRLGFLAVLVGWLVAATPALAESDPGHHAGAVAPLELDVRIAGEVYRMVTEYSIHLWTGILVGGILTSLVTSNTVAVMLGGALGGVLGNIWYYNRLLRELGLKPDDGAAGARS